MILAAIQLADALRAVDNASNTFALAVRTLEQSAIDPEIVALARAAAECARQSALAADEQGRAALAALGYR